MSWFDDIAGSLPPSSTALPPARPATAPVKVEPVKPEPPKREVEKPRDDPMPMGWSYGSMMLDANAAYLDLVTGTKRAGKGVELPCGGCIEAIAEQFVR